MNDAFLVVPLCTIGTTSAPATLDAAGNAEIAISAACAGTHISNNNAAILFHNERIPGFRGDSVAALGNEVIRSGRWREKQRAGDMVCVFCFFSILFD